MTFMSVESSIIGTFANLATFSRNDFISLISSLSGFARHISITSASPFICSLATSVASSNFSFAIRFLNIREPITFVLSPT